MLHKKPKKELRNPAQAGVKKEMAKPRMAKSARIKELNLDTARIPDQPSTSLPGTVDKTSLPHGGTNRERYKLSLTDPTTGIAISALKIR
jgi:hypothetical protein